MYDFPPYSSFLFGVFSIEMMLRKTGMISNLFLNGKTVVFNEHVLPYTPENGFCKDTNQHRMLPAVVLTAHVTDGGLATPLDTP